MISLVSLFVPQGEPEQQAEPDDQREPVHLFLAHADETRLHHDGRPDCHPHLPDNHRELHPPVRVLLLQSAAGRRPSRLPHLHALLRGRNLSLLLHGRRLLVLADSVPDSLRPPSHPSCYPTLRPSYPPPPPPPPSTSVPTPLPTSYSSVPDPSPAAALAAPPSPPYGTTHAVNQGSRERGKNKKEDSERFKGSE